MISGDDPSSTRLSFALEGARITLWGRYTPALRPAAYPCTSEPGAEHTHWKKSPTEQRLAALAFAAACDASAFAASGAAVTAPGAVAAAVLALRHKHYARDQPRRTALAGSCASSTHIIAINLSELPEIIFLQTNLEKTVRFHVKQ